MWRRALDFGDEDQRGGEEGDGEGRRREREAVTNPNQDRTTSLRVGPGSGPFPGLDGRYAVISSKVRGQFGPLRLGKR